nr:RNA-directed DNA polymerase, eukaryota, reverse transcriptase zinc-binding domain protein [Tanacetum cinerariifolium]
MIFFKNLPYSAAIPSTATTSLSSFSVDTIHKEKLEASELAQKVKIKWSIEGDENSRFFHGMLNKKRNQQAIRGILKEGKWVDDPKAVKDKFLSHFQERFDTPTTNRLMLDLEFPKQISVEQLQDLERNVSIEEIKRAVWDCGLDKSPGPDGFTFDFYRRYWDILEKDVVDAVSFFFTVGSFPKGGNASFIALIPIMQEARVVKDFRPICLIGSMYKIIAQILANRLVGVLGDLIHEVQSAFIANRQIIDEFGECSNVQRHIALDCFHKASGLHMNLQKSKLMGISVKDDIVSRAAIKMGCSTLKAPFIYLGVKVGGSMARVRFIRALHGECGGLIKVAKAGHISVWRNIITDISNLRMKGIDLLCFINKKAGNGIKTSFWEEKWRGDMSFKEKYPRVFALESNKKISVSNKMHHIDIGTTLSNSNDRWSWSLAGSGEFSVASVRKHIDDLRLGGSPQKTRWISTVPIKINILAWKVRYDFLPTHLNLSRRCIEIQSIYRSCCNKEVESTNHMFFTCSLVRNIYRKIALWWDFPIEKFVSYECWLEWFSSQRMKTRHKSILEGVFYITWWLIWNHRNKTLFDVKYSSMADLFDILVSKSFFLE